MTKKESVAHYRLDSTGNPLLDTDSTISIADLLGVVKKNFEYVLPKDVLDHMNIKHLQSTGVKILQGYKSALKVVSNKIQTS